MEALSHRLRCPGWSPGRARSPERGGSRRGVRGAGNSDVGGGEVKRRGGLGDGVVVCPGAVVAERWEGREKKEKVVAEEIRLGCRKTWSKRKLSTEQLY